MRHAIGAGKAQPGVSIQFRKSLFCRNGTQKAAVDHTCSLFLQLFSQTGGKSFRSGHRDAQARQFSLRCSGRERKSGHFADDNDRRRLKAGFFHRLRQRFQGRADTALSVGGSIHDHCCRRIPSFSRLHQLSGKLLQMMHSHQNDQSPFQARQGLIIYRREGLLLSFSGNRGSGKNRDHPAALPVRHRNSRGCRCGNGRGDARNFLAGNPFPLKRQHFLAASPEHIRVSAFQAHHNLSFFCLFQQKPVDLLLRHGLSGIPLPHIDFFAGQRRLFQQLCRRQAVI